MQPAPSRWDNDYADHPRVCHHLARLRGRARADASPTAAADAAMAGDEAALRTVLKSGANVNAPQGDGMTALHWAAERSDAAAAALLLKAGADPRAMTRI